MKLDLEFNFKNKKDFLLTRMQSVIQFFLTSDWLRSLLLDSLKCKLELSAKKKEAHTTISTKNQA